jgi:hypothetical protein
VAALEEHILFVLTANDFQERLRRSVGRNVVMLRHHI